MTSQVNCCISRCNCRTETEVDEIEACEVERADVRHPEDKVAAAGTGERVNEGCDKRAVGC